MKNIELTSSELSNDGKLNNSLEVSVIDTEIVLTVSIPIVTNGLVIEFNEVADTRGSSEVHCPR